MPSRAPTVARYLKAQPKASREALDTLRRMIRIAAPNAKEAMVAGMPAYMMGSRMVAAMAAQKKNIALYVSDYPLVAKYRARLGSVDCGKSCIRFKRIDDLDLGGVANLLAEAAGRD
jgi:uncharacterized protein YdhG (YjbR/CyaY superfamily)